MYIVVIAEINQRDVEILIISGMTLKCISHLNKLTALPRDSQLGSQVLFINLGKHNNLSRVLSAFIMIRNNSQKSLERYCRVDLQKSLTIYIGPLSSAPQSVLQSQCKSYDGEIIN